MFKFEMTNYLSSHIFSNRDVQVDLGMYIKQTLSYFNRIFLYSRILISIMMKIKDFLDTYLSESAMYGWHTQLHSPIQINFLLT